MATINLTRETFEQTVSTSPMVVIDFWAPWCGPCRAFAPSFEAASEKHPDIVFGKVNTEEQPELGGAFGIRSIPTLMVMRENVILYSQPGALPPHALEEIILKAKSLDMAVVHKEIAEQEASEQPAS